MSNATILVLAAGYFKDSPANFSAALHANDPLPNVSWDIAVVARTCYQLTGTQTSCLYAVECAE